MCKPTIRHLYNLQSDHPDKPRTNLTSYKVTILLITFSMLYFTSL